VHNALNRLYLVMLAKGSRDVAQTEHSALAQVGHKARIIADHARAERPTRENRPSFPQGCEKRRIRMHRGRRRSITDHSRRSVTKRRRHERNALRTGGIPQGRETAGVEKLARACTVESSDYRIALKEETNEGTNERRRDSSRVTRPRDASTRERGLNSTGRWLLGGSPMHIPRIFYAYARTCAGTIATRVPIRPPCFRSMTEKQGQSRDEIRRD